MLPSDAADVLVVVEWATISGYFVRRFVKHKKPVSLCIAAMALGWVFLGLESRFVPSHLLQAIAIALGVVVWYAIFHVEKRSR